MRGAVARGHVTVFRLDQNAAAFIDKDGAERMIAMRHRAARHLETAPQKFFVMPRCFGIGTVVHVLPTAHAIMPMWVAAGKRWRACGGASGHRHHGKFVIGTS